MRKTKPNIIPLVLSGDKAHETFSNECILLRGPVLDCTFLYDENCTTQKTDPQMVDCIMEEKRSLNLCLYRCIAGTKNSTVTCPKKGNTYMMHSHFKVNT
jgi:hypothetical protein